MTFVALVVIAALASQATSAATHRSRPINSSLHRFKRETTPDGLYVPDLYELCANEGEQCDCYGVVIIGDPITNRWSEAIEGKGEVMCKSSSFKKQLDAPNQRQCWCKPKEVAKKQDYPFAIPDLNSVNWTDEKIADGLTWKSAQGDEIFGGPQALDVLLVDPSKRKMELAYSEPGLMKTSDMILEHGGLAGVNGGFHAYGRPDIGTITMMRVDGEDIVTENSPEEWDLTTEDVEGVAVITEKGRLKIVTQADEDAWMDEPTFLHVGPLLILEGVRQPFDSKTWNHVDNPRTGLCVMKNGKEALVTVDGRYYYASGMTVPEFAAYLQALGCENAINLDGGGSTTMWIEGKGVVNEPRDKPSEGEEWDENLTERSVSNAFAVI